MNVANRQVVLRRYPVGAPKVTDFEVVSGPVPKVADGQVLCRAIYLTVDPYIRVHLSPRMAPGYTQPTPLGGVIPGEAVLRVEDSRHPDFAEGDLVAGFSGWQDYAALPGAALRKLDPRLGPLPSHLGTLGMPGLTAYAGLFHLAEIKAGETVFVSAALGGVGAVAGQLAHLKGCRVVGVSSSEEKRRYAVESLGYDVCLDRTAPDLAARLGEACPDGIDVDFENAGGEVFWAALAHMKTHGRMILCGLVSSYNNDVPPPGPDLTPDLLRMIALKRLVLKGLMVADFWELRPRFLKEMSELIGSGRLKTREHVVDGIDKAGGALIDMLAGRTFGKTVVRIADDPAA